MKIIPEDIDAILPQTQCGLCGYGGCMPYAKALIQEHAEINLCPPGGVKGLYKIAELMQKDPLPFIDEMREKTKPRMIAKIREAECIGCAKCIKACPVDAIIGSGKLMHSVITSECTGCELCIAPCPVDCIDLNVVHENGELTQAESDLARKRFYAREKRLQQKVNKEKVVISMQQNQDDKKAFIAAALQRVKAKTSS